MHETTKNLNICVKLNILWYYKALLGTILILIMKDNFGNPHLLNSF